jgi:hypothetical protein
MIKETEIKRNLDGYWTHPDYPPWEDYVGKYVVKDWEEKNMVNLYFEHFELTASDALHHSYFESGSANISDWKPECSIDNSFLISIHDTEDSPVAVFAVKTRKRLDYELSIKIKNF